MSKQRLGDYIEEYSVKNKNDEEYPVYSVTNKQGFCTEYFNKDVSGADKTKYKIVPFGYFAYNPSRINVGSVDWQSCEENVIVSPLYVVFKCKNGLTQDYLKYFLKSSYGLRLINSSVSGSVRNNLKFGTLSEFVLNIGDSREQQRIVNDLDKIKNAIDIEQRQIDLCDELVKARFVEMFGDPKLNPNGYPVHQLSEYIHFITSGSRGWAEYCVDDGSEWFITIKNVKDCHITTDNMQPVNAPDNAEAKRTRVQEGDLLISITADLGRTGVVTKEIADHGAYINQHLTCIRLNRSVLEPLYVAYFMESSAGKEQFFSKSQSAVKAGLNFNSIKTLWLTVPPLTLQQEFLRFVAQIDKSKVVIQKRIDLYTELLNKKMDEFFNPEVS